MFADRAEGALGGVVVSTLTPCFAPFKAIPPVSGELGEFFYLPKFLLYAKEILQLGMNVPER